MTKHVLVTDYAWPSLDIERRILGEVDAALIAVSESDGDDALIALAHQADGILTNWRRIPPEALEGAAACVVVSRYGIGVDNIPVERATGLGIVVANVPDFCIDEVSDHTMALLLACSRRIVRFALATSAGVWSLGASAPGMARLRGQTLGLIGYGQLAKAVAAKAIPFGLEVIAYTPRLRPGPLSPGVTATDDIGRVLAESDYVSLHAPATTETRHIIDEGAIGRMKPTAYLINTSRGALIDEAALARALREGWIAGAAVDVVEHEPASPDHPLLGLDNIIVTPHAAFYSEEAIRDVRERAASNAAAALRGDVPAHVVNPRVLSQPTCRLSLQ
jgi:D-3-phosphoglycerate dehydrogenase